MSIRREERGADSPFVERVTHVRYDRTVDDWTTPDGAGTSSFAGYVGASKIEGGFGKPPYDDFRCVIPST